MPSGGGGGEEANAGGTLEHRRFFRTIETLLMWQNALDVQILLPKSTLLAAPQPFSVKNLFVCWYYFENHNEFFFHPSATQMDSSLRRLYLSVAVTEKEIGVNRMSLLTTGPRSLRGLMKTELLRELWGQSKEPCAVFTALQRKPKEPPRLRFVFMFVYSKIARKRTGIHVITQSLFAIKPRGW